MSGLIPLFSFAYGLLRGGSIDVIALFAAEDVIVTSISALLAHTPMMTLAGRSLQNAILGAIFLASLALNRPLMLYISRQFVTGNKPTALLQFDQMASRKDAIHVYRVMTLVWALALFAKSTASFAIALTVTTDHFLLLSPLVNYGTDVLLVVWSFRYGYSHLGHYVNTVAEAVTPVL